MWNSSLNLLQNVCSSSKTRVVKVGSKLIIYKGILTAQFNFFDLMFFTDFFKYIMTANRICFKNYFMEVPPPISMSTPKMKWRCYTSRHNIPWWNPLEWIPIVKNRIFSLDEKTVKARKQQRYDASVTRILVLSESSLL